jgi:hypothetical protein
MSATSMQEAFSASVAEGGELAADLDYRITLSDGQTIRKHFHDSAKGSSLVDQFVSSMLFDMFLLVENPFHEANVHSIDAEMTVRPGLQQTVFIGARLEHPAFLAGDRVRVTGRFRPWREQEYDRDFYFDLPRDLRPGTYVLHLADNNGALHIEKANRPENFMPRDYNGILRFIEHSAGSDDELKLYLFEPATDLNLSGYALAQLPSTTAMLIQSTAPPRLQLQSVGKLLSVTTQHMPESIYGTQTLMIQVVDHFNE